MWPEKESPIPSKRVSYSTIPSHVESILGSSISNFEAVVLGNYFVARIVSQIYSQGDLSSCSQPVDLLKPQPVFTMEIIKTSYIVFPTMINIYRTILSSLEDCPSSSINIHVAVCLKSVFIVGIKCVHSTFVMSIVVRFFTVSVGS